MQKKKCRLRGPEEGGARGAGQEATGHGHGHVREEDQPRARARTKGEALIVVVNMLLAMNR